MNLKNITFPISSSSASNAVRPAVLVVWLLLFGGGAAFAQPALTAGPASLRDLETDRPDATESPVTVDRGRFQYEASFVSFSRNDDVDTRTESLGIMESNIKYGLRDDTDVQLVFTPWTRETTETAGLKTTTEDFSDLTVRIKQNLWGNDDGPTAFALLPFVKIPTGTALSNEQWEGGVATPFSWRAGEDWGLGAQVQVDRVFDDVDGGMDWEFSHTLVLGFDLTEKAGVYLEYLGVAGDHPYNSYFSGGATFALDDYIQLDAGALIGLNEAADDLTVFSGISWKF